MFCVPLYFQITQHVSSAVAGAHLFPAVAGNTIGALIAGIVIKRYVAICEEVIRYLTS